MHLHLQELVWNNDRIRHGCGKETGGIILIKDDLRDVVTALDLGKKTVAKIKQNLFTYRNSGRCISTIPRR